MSTDADVRALERAEIEALADVYESAPSSVVSAVGLSVERVGHHVVTATAKADVLAQNRALGLGLDARPSDIELADVLDAFDRAGSPRFFVPVAPTRWNDDAGARLEALGLTRYNAWMRLSRELSSLPAVPTTNLEVRQIGLSEAEVFGRIVADAFQYPPAVSPLASATVGQLRWRHYLAYDNERPVAAAAMCLVGPAAWFGFAATCADARGRGAQKALVVRRLHDAAALGCRHVSVETAQLTATKDAPSFRNLMRLGFEVAYERPNYIWLKAQGSGLTPP